MGETPGEKEEGNEPEKSEETAPRAEKQPEEKTAEAEAPKIPEEPTAI